MKNTKHTILISVLAIVFSVAMCLGTTFAFFTIMLTSSDNKVEAGGLDVDFELLTKGTTDDWVSLKANSDPVFKDDILWECGYTDVKVLRVKNNSDLAIKWEARYAPQEEMSKLADVLDVYLIKSDTPLTYPTERAELENWGEPITLTKFLNDMSTNLCGEIPEGESDYFGIALKMQNGVADEYRNLTLGAFDIHIVATQQTEESDFFDDQYDEDAKYPCTHINKIINVTVSAVAATDTTEATVGTQQTVCDDCGEILAEEDCYLVLALSTTNKPTVKDIIEGYGADIVIPDTYQGVSITAISSEAFKDATNLTSITIPDKITSIGQHAFRSCSSLTSIDIPDGVTSIPAYTFCGCSSLTSIHIPESVTSISVCAFQGCSSLTSIEIPESVTSISGQAFYGCKSLESIKIPTGITSIGDWTFTACSGLTSVSIPESVTSIGIQAFYGCRSLESIEIPAAVTSIGGGAFKDCKALTSITIPDGVTDISSSTFFGCSTLVSVDIPDSVTSIGDLAFRECSSLTSIVIPANVTSIGAEAFCLAALSNAEFKNTTGWWYADTEGATSGTEISEIDLADTATAATYLKATYTSKYWYRTAQEETQTD